MCISRLCVEHLEDRRLLSLTPELVLGGFVGGISPIDALTNVGETLFFSADDGVHGRELWKSDGTAEGTVMVKDVWRGASTSNPHDFLDFNGTLYFAADDGVHGRELWKSDGTPEGTVMVHNLRGSDDASPASLVEFDGALYFTARRGDDRGLWRTDGTREGTVLISPRRGVSVGHLTAAGGNLFFSGCDDTYGCELWKSDGTPDGTVMVKDLFAGERGSKPAEFVEVNDQLLFWAVDDVFLFSYSLWKSDGTLEGTVMIQDGFNTLFPPRPNHYSTNVSGTLFFRHSWGEGGRELWKSDGTPEGTFLVKDINSGEGGSFPTHLTDVNGMLLFTAGDDVHGRELWKSDGTAEGTVMVKDIRPGADRSSPYGLTNVNGTLFFTGDDGTHGVELWKSDGTATGTAMVGDIAPGNGSIYPGNLTPVNRTIYFSANNDSELWKVEPAIGDSNYDGIVDITDLNNVRKSFGQTGDNLPGDTNGDGVVGIDDLNTVRNNFGASTVPALAVAQTAIRGTYLRGTRDSIIDPLAQFVISARRLESGIITVEEQGASRPAVDSEFDVAGAPASFQNSVAGHLNRLHRSSRGHEVVLDGLAIWDKALLDLL